jgi:stearoyl-CoA desaturase (delta-9 desaturase)
MLRGMWHAHVGWIFQGDPNDLSRYVADLVRDRSVRVVSKLWGLWAILGLVIPAVLGGLLTMSWSGVLFGFIWGGLARIFLVHHVTWSINSVCHIWGSRPFRSHDESRNNFLFGVLGLGEGWHNNHHAFPTSARHGLRWWELDLSYIFIKGLALVGLAWDIRVPNQDRINAKLAT